MKKSSTPAKSTSKRQGKPAQAKSVHIPKRWAWHYRVLQTLRERLLEDRASRIVDTSEPLEPHSMNIADTATDAFDHDMSLSILSQDEHAIREIDAAQQRILDDTYGICEETGKAIPASRLRALPWTRLTMKAAREQERQGLVHNLQLGELTSVRDTKAKSFRKPE